MNRRTFLKTTAVVTALPLASCENKPKTKSKWIAFKDQMPKSTDKFEIKERRTGTIKKGQILEFDWKDENIDVVIGKNGEKLRLYSKTKFITYRLTENSMHVVEQYRWDWRYVS